MKRNRILSAILVAIMIFSILPTVIFADTINDNWENCTACSEENPHIISTKADLNKIREHKNTTLNVIDGYFKLGNDIVFEAADFEEGGDYYGNGEGWLSIGHNNIGGAYGSNNGISFNGYFDGNNKTISGITTTRPSNFKKYNGLFAFVAGNAKIFDLTLEDFYIKGDMSGVLTGMVNSQNALVDNIKLKNCQLETVGLTNMASGILIGKLQGGTVQNIEITDCTYVGNSWGSGYIVGLIQNSALKNVVVDNCNMSSWTHHGLLASSIQGNWVQIEDIEIKNSNYNQGHSDSIYYLAETLSVTDFDNSWIKNVNISLNFSGNLGAEYKPLSSGNAVESITMDNINFDITFDAENEQTGVMKMKVDKNVIYVVEQTINVAKPTSNGGEIIAYTNGGVFENGTVFENDKLATPVKTNCLFGGWYTDSELTSPFAGTPVAGASYYAKWEALPEREFVVTTDKSEVVIGETVEVTVTLNGTDLVGAEWTLVYDASKFELVSGNINGKKIAGSNNTFAASEVMATYTFKAIVQEPDGISALFTVENGDAWDIREANMGDIYTTAAVTPAEVTTVNPAYEAEVKADYVAGKMLVLAYTNSADISFSYAGATMYDVSTKYAKDGYAYTFAIVVDAAEGDYAENIAVVYGCAAPEYVLVYDKNNYDINNSGEINLRDVTVVFGVYNGTETTFANYMNIVLNADINADGVVDGLDTDAFVRFVRAYTAE